jgi:hypothetical protein
MEERFLKTNPPIHIFARKNVCIRDQAAQFGALLASMHANFLGFVKLAQTSLSGAPVSH